MEVVKKMANSMQSFSHTTRNDKMALSSLDRCNELLLQIVVYFSDRDGGSRARVFESGAHTHGDSVGNARKSFGSASSSAALNAHTP